MMTHNETLHAKLDAQLAESQVAHGHDPVRLLLTHDEIDEWRAQFSGAAIPVSILAYKGIRIDEVE